MPSGGARTRSGPAPDPNALRRERDQGEWVILPAAGRQGALPDWPLDAADPRELVVWERLWRSPQAIMWEKYGQDLEVAQYCRALVRFERPRGSVQYGTLLRQIGDSLGLTTPGMRSHRWRIERDEPRELRATGTAGRVRADGRPSAKDRLRVVRGTAGDG